MDAIHLAAGDDDEEDDEEEEAVDYRDRVREIKQWMNRRDSERKGDAPSLDLVPSTPARPYPRYFQDRGYDESGYRRPRGDVRIRLRSAPGYSYSRHHYQRHPAWHRHVRSHVHLHQHHRHGQGGHRIRHHHSYHHYHAPIPRHGGRHHHAAQPKWHSSHHPGKHFKAAPTRHAVKAAVTKRPHAKKATGKKGRSRR